MSLQVGTYDPFSDDPQLGVQKIALCCATEMLFVGGTAGQVVILHFEQEEKEVDIKVRLQLWHFHCSLLHSQLSVLFHHSYCNHS